MAASHQPQGLAAAQSNGIHGFGQGFRRLGHTVAGTQMDGRNHTLGRTGQQGVERFHGVVTVHGFQFFKALGPRTSTLGPPGINHAPTGQGAPCRLIAQDKPVSERRHQGVIKHDLGMPAFTRFNRTALQYGNPARGMASTVVHMNRRPVF